jgi:hypothetical protein
MAFLPAETLDFGHRQPCQADFSERLAHFVEFERFNDCSDALHGGPRLVIGKVKGKWMIFILRRTGCVAAIRRALQVCYGVSQ